jgi:hypothetical protein
MESTIIKHDSIALTHRTTLDQSHLDQNSFDQSTLDDNISSTVVPSDLWSAAYREAVDSLGKDVDVAILMGSNAAQLLNELEEADGKATEQSVFLRGVAYLRSIQVPLERFKLALDLASPLGSLDPAAAGVFGAVRGVTAVSLFSLRSRPIYVECIRSFT